MGNKMTKRLALITGGTTSIGAAICKAFKMANYEVVANFIRDEDQANSFAKEMGVSVYQWDVSDFNQCENGVKRVCDDFKTTIDVLVNNAGITRDHIMHKMTKEDWNAVISVDLGACFNMSHAVIKDMREKEFGRIISVSSINAQLGQVGQTNYSAAKAGVIGFTKSLARESASKNITVNAIAPRYTDTSMVESMPADVLKEMISHVPMGRLAQPEEIAHAVMFLASEKSGFITGQTLSINGGHYM